MKRGFTLIELLAVIVILAIIALIATPIILGIINDARDESYERTAELVASELELAYTSYMFANDAVEPTTHCASYVADTTKHFAMDGVKSATCEGEVATITLDNGNKYTATYANGTWTVTTDLGKKPTKSVMIATK